MSGAVPGLQLSFVGKTGDLLADLLVASNWQTPNGAIKEDHVLRKTCGIRIADGGGGVSAVASHLRHKNLQTASRYIDRRGASPRALKALES